MASIFDKETEKVEIKMHIDHLKVAIDNLHDGNTKSAIFRILLVLEEISNEHGERYIPRDAIKLIKDALWR